MIHTTMHPIVTVPTAVNSVADNDQANISTDFIALVAFSSARRSDRARAPKASNSGSKIAASAAAGIAFRSRTSSPGGATRSCIFVRIFTAPSWVGSNNDNPE